MIVAEVGSKRKMVSLMTSCLLPTITECCQKEIGVDEIEIRSMYESGKLSKVSRWIFSVRIPSQPRTCSLLLSSSRQVA